MRAHMFTTKIILSVEPALGPYAGIDNFCTNICLLEHNTVTVRDRHFYIPHIYHGIIIPSTGLSYALRILADKNLSICSA
jgi:hypothetical protein